MTSVSSSTTSRLAQHIASTSSLDTNGDGVVSAEEAAAASRSQDPTVSTDNAASSSTSLLSGDMMAMFLAKGDIRPTEVAAQASRFGSADSDGDGTVTEQEFVAARPNDVSEEEAIKLFSALDADNTGTLTDMGHKKQTPTIENAQAMGSLSGILAAESDASDDTTGIDAGLGEMNSVIAAYRSGVGTAEEATSTSATLARTAERAKQSLTL